MAEHQRSITNNMSSKENKSQSAEAGEKQRKTLVRLNSSGINRPNFCHDSDRPSEIHSDDKKTC